MAGGYVFAAIMAAIPLLSSTYSKTSVCLPLGIDTFLEKVSPFSTLESDIIFSYILSLDSVST
jgi:hypothetical protein